MNGGAATREIDPREARLGGSGNTGSGWRLKLPTASGDRGSVAGQQGCLGSKHPGRQGPCTGLPLPFWVSTFCSAALSDIADAATGRGGDDTECLQDPILLEP